MSEGLKFDKDKLRMDLVPTTAIKAIAQVCGHGAAKYDEYNWAGGIAFSRIYAATLRHLIDWWEGKDDDGESGINHIKHAICNLAFLTTYITYASKYNEFDDRPFEKFLTEDRTNE